MQHLLLLLYRIIPSTGWHGLLCSGVSTGSVFVQWRFASYSHNQFQRDCLAVVDCARGRNQPDRKLCGVDRWHLWAVYRGFEFFCGVRAIAVSNGYQRIRHVWPATAAARLHHCRIPEWRHTEFGNYRRAERGHGSVTEFNAWTVSDRHLARLPGSRELHLLVCQRRPHHSAGREYSFANISGQRNLSQPIDDTHSYGVRDWKRGCAKWQCELHVRGHFTRHGNIVSNRCN